MSNRPAVYVLSPALAVALFGCLAPRPAAAQEPTCVPLDAALCRRTAEPALLARWPSVASRIGDTLRVHLLTGEKLDFVDRPGPGDGERLWRFGGVLEPHDLILIDERRYIGHTHWLIHSPSGRRQELECFPVLSPDAEFAFCGYGVLDELGARAYVAVYRVTGRILVLQWSHDLGEDEPAYVRWTDNRSIEFTTRSVRGYGGADPRCINRVIGSAAGWQIVRCRS